jgi:dihydroneopterin aldolase
VGQLFSFDIRLILGACPACGSDDINETVNYAEVADCVAGVSASHDYNLLEALAAAAADAIIERFPPVRQVSVRASKNSPPMPHSVDAVAVTVERRRRDGGL